MIKLRSAKLNINMTPPKIATRLLLTFIRRDLQEEVVGDRIVTYYGHGKLSNNKGRIDKSSKMFEIRMKP